MEQHKIKNLIAAIVSEPHVLQLLQDKPDELQSRFDLTEADLKALYDADLPVALITGYRQRQTPEVTTKAPPHILAHNHLPRLS